MPDQKRRFERFTTDLPVKISIPGDKGKARFEAFGKLRDVSLGGAFIQSGFRFKNEIDELEIELFLPSGSLPVKGKVVRQPDGGLGIQFIDVGHKERERLLKHFVPDRHRQFFNEVAGTVMPSLTVDRVSLLLHLWEEWQHDPKPAAAPPKSSPKPAARPAARPAAPARTPVKVTPKRR